MVMDQESRKTQSFAIWIAGAALGAVTMYLADPDRGRRRRALATDKMRSLAYKTGDAIDVATRDLGNRMQGWRAQANRMLTRRGGDWIDDETLVAQVRKEIGRAVTHPRAVKVDAHYGVITLHGPVLAHEKQQLLDCVRSVSGVTEVHDQLDVHETTAGVPSLQGEGKLRRSGSSSSLLQETWPPALRAAATVGGGALGLYGILRRTPAGMAAATVGLGLLARGISNQPFSRMTQARSDSQIVDLHKNIYIDAAPERVFDIWSNIENFPRFMSNVKEVRDLGNGRSHWVVSGPAGAQIEWNSVMTESVRPEVLSWNSEPNSTVQHTGTVRFERAGEGTQVSVHMSYSPPAGSLGHAVASVFNGNPKRQMDEDLMRMKTYIESSIPPHDAAQRMRESAQPGAGMH
jgi:uncharacterized membrane protein